MSTTTTSRKTYSKSDYLQPSSVPSYDSSQSPLALLAQTCSSIGKDCPSPSSSIRNSTSPIITSLVTKSSSNLSNSDKSFSSSLHSNSKNPTKKSTFPSKNNPGSKSSSLATPNRFPPIIYDPATSVATLLLRSSLAYLASQQHSYSTSCTMPGCLQCETVRHVFSTSINNQPYVCHWASCNARFSSNNELIDHIRFNHRSSKMSNHHRFHPYLKSTRMFDSNDQLPFFYPHLSLSPMTETTGRINKNTDNNN